MHEWKLREWWNYHIVTKNIGDLLEGYFKVIERFSSFSNHYIAALFILSIDK